MQEKCDHGSFSFKGFYIRRSLRIFPAYYFFLLVMLLNSGVSGARYVTAVSLYLTDMIYMLGSGGIPHELVHSWSLSVEEHFYMLWPLTLLLMGRRALQLSVFTIVAAWIWRVYLVYSGANWPRLYLAFDSRLDSILIGCTLSLLWMNPPLRMRMRAILGKPWAPYAAVLALAGSALLLGRHTMYSGAGWSSFWFWNVRLPVHDLLIGLLLLVLLIHPASRLSHVLSTPSLVWLGRLSYSLYLWHMVGIALGDQLYGHCFTDRTWYTSLLFEVVKLAISLALAMSSYYLVERPFLSLKQFWEPHRQESPRRPALAPSASS